MREFCVDASVVVKVALPESLSVEAKALFDESNRKRIVVFAPPVLEGEVDSAIRWHVKQGLLSKAGGDIAYATLDALPIQIQTFPGMKQRAREIADMFNQGRVYDSLYAALAELRGCELWTADEAYYKAVISGLPFVRFLGNYKGLP